MASSIDAPRNDVNPGAGLNPAAPNAVDSLSVKVDRLPDVVKVSMVNVMLNWVREKIVDPVRNSLLHFNIRGCFLYLILEK